MRKFTKENFVDRAELNDRDAAVYDSTYYHLIDLPFARDGLGVSYGEGLPSDEQLSLANKFSSNCNEQFFSKLDLWINEYRQAKFDLHPDCYDDYQNISIDNVRNHYGLYTIAILKDRIARNGNNFVFLAFRTDWFDIDSEMILNIDEVSIRCVAIQYTSGLDQNAFLNKTWANSEQGVRDMFCGGVWAKLKPYFFNQTSGKEAGQRNGDRSS